LGSDVYVHQSRVNYKPGFEGKEFFWHSDFETWHVEDGMPRMRAISCSFSLTENNPYNGPVMVVPGSHLEYLACPGRTPEGHHRQSLVQQEYGVPTHAQLTALIESNGIASALGKAGSLLLFDCNLMHGSSSNISPYPRNNVFIVFNSVYNRLRAPFCGLAPRPEHIASRSGTEVLTPREV
jgi:ectoine hydroxylase